MNNKEITKIHCFNCKKSYETKFKCLDNPEQNICPRCVNKELEEYREWKSKLSGFNSAESCANCNPCRCPQDKEKCRQKINRHAFMNADEFTDQALIEELIMRIKMGCIKIQEKATDKGGRYYDVDEIERPTYNYLHYYRLVDNCRRDLSRGLKKDEKTGELITDPKAKKPLVINLWELVDYYKEYRKLEDEDRLCNICLYKPLKEKKGMFCDDCWEREINTRERKEERKKIAKEKSNGKK